MDQLTPRFNALELSNQPSQSTSIFLSQPVEIILSIFSYLDPISQVSLAISCKDIYALLVSEGPIYLDPVIQEIFLQILERDSSVGDHMYYCHLCIRLHTFEKWWSPAMMPYEPWERPPHTKETRKHCRQRFYTLGSRLSVGYHHARLVMNHHFFGPACGLPLESLTYRTIPETRGKRLRLVQSMTARIIDDLLFLKCTHELTPVDDTVSPKAFLHTVDKYNLRVCHHTLVDKNVPTKHYFPLEETVPSIKKRGDTGLLVPCRDAQSSCKRCHTDVETTIKEDERTGHGLYVTIVSYHLFGSCRAPRDRHCRGVFDAHPYKRDTTVHPPGSIRQRWIDNPK